MTRTLDSLSTDFKPLAIELLARLTERGVMVMIVQTLRTPAEQQIALAGGFSRTALSKHLPRKFRGFDPGSLDAEKADAIDLCLWEQFQLHGPDKLAWSAPDADWAPIGELAEMLGLRWGGRWTDPHDPGHVELVVHPGTLAPVRSV